MAIQRYEEIPAVCRNRDCEAYKAFELIDTESSLIIRNDAGQDVYPCPECGENIILE